MQIMLQNVLCLPDTILAVRNKLCLPVSAPLPSLLIHLLKTGGAGSMEKIHANVEESFWRSQGALIGGGIVLWRNGRAICFPGQTQDPHP